jgi:hypothetical protein
MLILLWFFFGVATIATGAEFDIDSADCFGLIFADAT